MTTRINQGTDTLDRLYTVRPRNSKSVTQKRGNPCSIKFNLPLGDDADTALYTKDMPASTKSAFTDALGTTGFINFIAQSTSYAIQEKSQTVHTFGGAEAVYFYGRAPIMVNVSGLIVDDLDNDQFTKFVGLYNNFLRGSKASKAYSYVTLKLNNMSFVGSFVSISIQQSADRDTDVSFSAQFLAKTFTLVSTDAIYADGNGDYTSSLRVRDVDPTITQSSITSTINANSFDTVNTGYFGDIPTSFGTLPTVAGATGLTSTDIDKFFTIATDTISNIIAPFTDVIEQVDAYAKEVMGLMDAVESGLDKVLNLGNSVSNQVFALEDTLEDTFTKVCNFPASISNKLGSIGKAGGSELAILGNDSISSDTAATLLASAANVGVARGTPEGEAAVLYLARSNSQSGTAATTSTSSSTTISTADLSSSLVYTSSSSSAADETASLRVGG